MKQETVPSSPARSNVVVKKSLFVAVSTLFLVLVFAYYPCFKNSSVNVSTVSVKTDTGENDLDLKPVEPSLSYKEKMDHIINGDSSGKWKAGQTEPLAGAILPYKRIIAFYGNLYSKNMGILGELPKQEVLDKLQEEAKAWEQADTVMQVQPALHYIAVTAQGLPGKGNKYRLRMPFSQIDTVLKMAEKIDAIVFLDIQVALSTLEDEIPQLEKYLKLPNVHLGIDPEFSMKGGQKPGSVIGSFNAADINYAVGYLQKIVKDNNLPPKILIVHRFTQGMIKNYKDIKTLPGVQLVMHMDGWGFPAKKINTYKQFIYKEPVEYTGFKLFYKNDTKNKGRLLTPQELLKLKPQPVYIQYQ
ncbi:MAG TPA: hypothetical protein VKB95_09835 [Chitinophagaceae bacterium]|nr:hypothetical protein [Chitinophagaceae bacterium]